METFYDDGLAFSCLQCGHCCKDEPGYVFLSEKEIMSISSYLSVSTQQFLQDYCRSVPFGSFSLVSLREMGDDNRCVFYEDDHTCRIYDVRPVQCKSYPFWENLVSSQEAWNREASECPGMNHGTVHSKEEILSWLRLRRKNQPKMTS